MALVSEQRSRYEDKLKRELGSLILNALADPLTEDILLNADGGVWTKCLGSGFKRIGEMQASAALSAIGTIAAWRETVVTHDSPILETELPLDGSRFEGLIPPFVRNPVFAIRLRPKTIFSLQQYADSGVLSHGEDTLNAVNKSVATFIEEMRNKPHIEILRAAIRNKKNILVVGATGSGKTTFINAILAEIFTLVPNDRLVIIEDTTELQSAQPNMVDLRAYGAVSMLRALAVTLRLKPVRIVVGEVRGPEALALLKAWNTGHPGGAASIHANSAEAGLSRLEALVAEATAAPQQKLIAEAVDIVVFIDEENSLKAGRKVRELLVVEGYDEATKKYVFERM